MNLQQAADSDFSMDDDSASDLEETLDEQESHEKNVDHAKEIDTLKAESECCEEGMGILMTLGKSLMLM